MVELLAIGAKEAARIPRREVRVRTVAEPLARVVPDEDISLGRLHGESRNPDLPRAADLVAFEVDLFGGLSATVEVPNPTVPCSIGGSCEPSAIGTHRCTDSVAL